MSGPAATASFLASPAEGPAFPWGVKVLASVLMAWTAYWGLRSAPALFEADWQPVSLAVMAGALAIVAWCFLWLWRSRTSVDAEGIRQTWIWNRQVPWKDVASARLIGVRGLEWLIAPRLLVRARGIGGVMVFHSADPRVLAAFAALATLGAHAMRPNPDA